MSIDKNDIKKLDTAGKLDYLLDAALGLDAKYEPITYEQGLTLMEPVKTGTQTDRFEVRRLAAAVPHASVSSVRSSSSSATSVTPVHRLPRR